MKAVKRITDAIAHTDRAGVYQLPSEGVTAVQAAAAAQGFTYVRIDLSDCADKADFLARVATALQFPTWFGHNWDALADCLGDLSWLRAEGYVLVLDHADRFQRHDSAEFATALEVFEESAHGWRECGTPFWVFVGLSGDGIPALPRL